MWKNKELLIAEKNTYVTEEQSKAKSKRLKLVAGCYFHLNYEL